jgi:hypothetical protein
VAAPGLKPVGLTAEPVQPQHLPAQIQIPGRPVDKTRREDEPRGNEEGWSRQESVVQAQVELGHERSATWRRFQGGSNRRSNFGAVLIDGPKPSTLPPVTAEPPRDANGWQRIDRMHGQAALFEEKNRGNLDQLGSETALELDPSSPVPRRGAQGTKRRRYRLA